MIIEWEKTKIKPKKQNLRVEQSKGSSREKLNNNKKKNFRKTKPWHIISAGRKRLLFFLHRVTRVMGGCPAPPGGASGRQPSPLCALTVGAGTQLERSQTQTTADKALCARTLVRHLSLLTVLVVVFLSNHVQKGNSTSSLPPTRLDSFLFCFFFRFCNCK